MDPVSYDLLSDTIPDNVWGTLGGMLAQSGARDIDPIGLVNATPRSDKADKLYRMAMQEKQKSPLEQLIDHMIGGQPADVSSLLATGQLEDVTVNAGMGLAYAAMSGNTHASQLIKSMGIDEATKAVVAANALGETELSISAAQTFAQLDQVEQASLMTTAQDAGVIDSFSYLKGLGSDTLHALGQSLPAVGNVLATAYTIGGGKFQPGSSFGTVAGYMLGGPFGGMLGGAAGSLLEEPMDWLIDKNVELAEGLWDITEDAAEWVWDTTGDIFEGIGDAFEDIGSAIGDAAEDVWDEITSWF